MVSPLTKADQACYQYVDEKREELKQALNDPNNWGQRTDAGFTSQRFDTNERLGLDIENNYRMSDWPMFCYTSTVLSMVSILLSKHLLLAVPFLKHLLLAVLHSCITRSLLIRISDVSIKDGRSSSDVQCPYANVLAIQHWMFSYSSGKDLI